MKAVSGRTHTAARIFLDLTWTCCDTIVKSLKKSFSRLASKSQSKYSCYLQLTLFTRLSQFHERATQEAHFKRFNFHSATEIFYFASHSPVHALLLTNTAPRCTCKAQHKTERENIFWLLFLLAQLLRIKSLLRCQTQIAAER